MADEQQEDIEQPWSRLSGEDERWYNRFLAFRDMGPVRTIRGACHIEEDRLGRKRCEKPSRNWYDNAKKFRWHERAEAYDAYRREQVFTQGYAYDLTRISKLDKLAEKLEELINKQLANGKIPLSFALERYLQTLEAIAKETGGRQAKLELSGRLDSEVSATHRVVFVMPDRGDLDKDIEQMTPDGNTEQQEA